MKNLVTIILLLVAVIFTAATSDVSAQLPSDNLRLHLKADAGVTTVGDNVSEWADQSGNSLPNTVQATDANRPLFISDAINGRPALRFSGNQFLNLPTAGDIEIANSEYEIFIVYRSLATHSNVEFILAGADQEEFELHTNGGGGLRYIPNKVGEPDNTERYIDLGSAQQFTNNQLHFIRLQATEDEGVISVGETGITREKNSISSEAGQMLLGRRAGVTPFYLNGDIAEVIIYNAALSTEDREAVEEYLNDKYFGVEEPEQQATNALIDEITENSMRISAVAGDGKRRLIVAREDAAVDFVPANNTTYTANAEFGAGDDQGNGNYVVYAGTDIEVTITGLSAGPTYHFAVFEYNGSSGFETYLATSPAINSASTLPPFAGGDGTELSPYQIETPEQLDAVRDYLSAHFVLNNNIDLATYLSEGNPGYNDGAGWIPIGTAENPFTGSLDGNDKKIINLFIESSSNYLGLFGKLDGDVNKLELKDVSISNAGVQNEHVGSLAGYLDGGTVSKITANGEISASNGSNSTRGVGGLIGTGNNATIHNATVNVDLSASATSSNFGGVIGFSVTNLDIRDVNSTGKVTRLSGIPLSDSGGLAGYIVGSDNVIHNSSASGEVSGSDGIGGFIGIAENLVTLYRSYATGAVNGEDYVGGFIGLAVQSNIGQSYATGDVSGSSFVGGFIGDSGSTTIDQSYATGAVSGSSFVGGFLGVNFGSSTFTNSYWNIDTSGRATSAGGSGITGLTNAQMRNSASFTEFDFGPEGDWDIYQNISYPFLRDNAQSPPPGYNVPFAEGAGTAENPFQISTPEQLSSIRDYLSSHFILTANIDLEPYLSEQGPGFNDGAGWLPIGSTENPFTGSLDGNEKKISKLFIESSSNYLGLFGVLHGDVHNMELDSVSVSNAGVQNEHVGSLAGYFEGGTVNQITANGTISASNNINETHGVGGLIGSGKHATIQNATVDVDISVNAINSANFGGVIGYSETHLSISDVHATGKVTGNAVQRFGGLAGFIAGTENVIANATASGKVSGASVLGGFIGSASDLEITNSSASGDVSGASDLGGFIGSASDVEIANSSASGNISSTGNRVGGFIGKLSHGDIRYSYASGSTSSVSTISARQIGGFVGFAEESNITDAYATGNVAGRDQIGGFMGLAESSVTVDRSYASGAVSGSSDVGGFLGEDSESNTFTNSYWNTESSGQSSSAAGTGLTSAQMIQQTSFTGFDFGAEDPWDNIEGFSFPFLRDVSSETPLAAQISGSEGWRMMGSPVEESFADFFESFRVNKSNIYTWIETEETFSQQESMSDVITPGNGMIFYLDENEEFPKWLYRNSPTNPESVNVPVTVTDANDNEAIDGDEGWNLLSNPFGFPVDVDVLLDAADAIDQNVNLNVYIWDHSAGTEGEYVVLPYEDDQTIAPFQAFFMRFGTVDLDDNLAFDPATLRASDAVLLNTQETTEPIAEFSLRLRGEGLEHTWRAVFADEPDPRRNAFYLSSLASDRVSLTSRQDDARYVRQFYTAAAETTIEIPLAMESTKAGDFTISADFEGFTDWQFTITDTETGNTTNLSETDGFTFTAEEGISERFLLTVTNGSTVSSETEPNLPIEFGLSQNYPNPFNPSTVISYQLPINSEVRLEVFDILGRRVSTLINGPVEAGYHQTVFDARHLASGVYIYRFVAGEAVFTKKLTLIK